jgi:uncharacterized protein YyaL (SSP411 family)
MEHTTFEVQEAADVMNKGFVNIKVDREERPDVDKVYMNYILLTTGHGGWPMSVFIEPHSLAPIYGGTYYSAHGEGRRPGFIALCNSISRAWTSDRQTLLATSTRVTEFLKKNNSEEPIEESQRDAFLDSIGGLLLKGADQRIKSFDPVYGGWGEQPKFPQPVILTSLFTAHYLQGTPTSTYLDQIEKTLQHMYLGGIHDHLGGGFHRYSVTEDWKLPHFEKMLYDQGQIANAYLTAYQITGKQVYKSAAEDIFKYVATQLTDSATGGFFSAEDADSPLPSDPSIKREGAFYVWEYDEIQSLVTDEEFSVLRVIYGLNDTGNVPTEYDPHGEMDNKNILHTIKNHEEVSKATGFSPEKIRLILDSAHGKLAEARARRPRPHLDDKCVTVWNGMMIQAMTRGFQLLGDPQLLGMALASMNFVRSHLYNIETKTLLRTYRGGPSDIEAFAEDYASMIAALLDLYEADFNIAHLQWALELQTTMDQLFWDKENGAYFCDSGNERLHLLVRTKDDHDGSEPSYNSVAAHSLLRLHSILHREEFKKRAEDIFAAFSLRLSKMPLAVPMMTVAAAAYDAPPKSIVVYGPLESPETHELLKVLRSHYDPFRALQHASLGSEASKFFCDQGIAMFKDTEADLCVNGKPAVYICQDFACQLPITDPAELNLVLKKR